MSTLTASKPSQAAHPGSNLLPRADRSWLILLGLSVAFALARWCTLESFWGDSPRWIFEVYRSATGELPYRDFAWQYPPLSLFLFSGAVRLFGHTFPVVQLLLDLLSAGVVLLTWNFARRILPRPLPLLVAAALASAGASNSANFALFSLQIYTPAILTGMIGLLILLNAAIDYLQSGSLPASRLAWISLGATICLLSKPEFIAGSVASLLALALADRRVWFEQRPASAWLSQYTKLALVSLVPALLGYAALCAFCGTSNVAAGVAGYGLASLSCPWWPTGLGLLGALTALGYGVLLAALFSLTRTAQFRERYGSRYTILWIAAALSAVLVAAYLPFCKELPMFQGRITLSHTLTYFLSTGTMLLPVMWFSIVLSAVLAIGLVRAYRHSAFAAGTRFPPGDAVLLIVLGAAVAMSLRGLFSGTMSQLSLASVAAYPLWFVLGPYLLIRFLDRASPSASRFSFPILTAPAAVVALVAVFALLRLAGVAVGEIRRPYAKIATREGVIRLKDLDQSPKVYAFIAQHAAPHEPVLDLAGGGGINIGQQHPSPLFSTQFTALAPPARYLELDARLIAQHPPRLIVANAGDDFGATYGICMNTGCTFPHFVWHSTKPACNAAVTFPALDYIRQNYAPLASFGDKIIYLHHGG